MTTTRESGIALIVALLLLLLVTLSLMAVAGYVQVRINAFRVEQRTVILTALADAAMAETLAELKEDRHFGGVTERDFGAGTISSAVRRSTSSLVDVTAVGRITGWRATIEARVEVSRRGPRAVSWTLRHGPG